MWMLMFHSGLYEILSKNIVMLWFSKFSFSLDFRDDQVKGEALLVHTTVKKKVTSLIPA